MSQHHDPVHPDGEHLTAEVLAELAEGLLDDASAQNARHHLIQCADCRGLQHRLEQVTDSLRTLVDTTDVSIPDQVWTAISGALASEPVITPEGSATVVPLAAAASGPARRRRPGIGLVAGAAGIALVGAIGYSMAVGGDQPASTTAAGDDRSSAESLQALPASDFQATRSGTRYREDDLSQQVTQLVAARSSLETDATGGPEPTTGPSGSPTPPPTDATPPPEGDGQGAVQQLLRTAAPMATDPAAAQACLQSYLQVTDQAPLAVDLGLWEGKPAAVVVLPLSDPTMVEVWVIDPLCDTSGGRDPLYYFATVER